MTSITIPDGVTSIGDAAFNCSSLTSINVGDNNAQYKSYNGVLYNKDMTTLIACPRGRAGSFVVPNKVTSIGNYAFWYCSGLTSINIPNGVTSIGGGAFGGCSGLTEVTIPDGVTSIGERAFNACSGLTSITIPDGVTSIGEKAFNFCSGLTSINVGDNNAQYKSYNGVLYNKDMTALIAYPGGLTGGFIVPSGVTSIEYGAFWHCDGLTSITIPDGFTSIAASTFRYCI